MKIKRNLFITNTGDVRMTKQDTGTNPNELAVQLLIDVPNVFFKRPMPVVNLEIPEEYLMNPQAEVVASWVAPEIAGALQIDVKTVEDGMVNMIRDEIEKRGNEKTA